MKEIGEVRKLRKLRILAAPLDWGLGHATRCIPIIQELVSQGCEVTLAGEGAQEILLKKEFPSLPFLSLAGYRVRYAGNGRNMIWNMIRQTPRLREAIQYEHDWLKRKVNELGFDAVISDNRYGLYHKKIPCVFITHQLFIKSPWKWTEKMLQMQNYRYINRFSECWVPDHEGSDNLAGELSHPSKKPNIPLRYIGWLSRMKKNINSLNTPLGLPDLPTEQAGGKAGEGGNNHLLIILSGPEPQRSIFENIIIKQISLYNGSATVLRGLPASTSVIPSTNSIHFYNHLGGEELNTEMEKAAYVIARSGYSTLMDIMALKKKCIIVPTPGQTEQEYLANYLAEKQLSIHTPQKNFSLNDVLKKAESFSFRFPELVPMAPPAPKESIRTGRAGIGMESNLKKTIARFLSSL